MERFRDEELPEKIWKALAEKERLEAARREAFEAELAAEKVAKTAERAEAIEAFVAFGCGEVWEAEKMLLRTIEAHVFGASEEE
jgi:phage FluMu protein gp41